MPAVSSTSRGRTSAICSWVIPARQYEEPRNRGRVICILNKVLLGARPLPFVADPVQALSPATRRMAHFLADIDEPVSDLHRIEIAVAAADALSMLAGRPGHDRTVIDIRAVELAREYLAAHAREQTPAATLEKITGTDR